MKRILLSIALLACVISQQKAMAGVTYQQNGNGWIATSSTTNNGCAAVGTGYGSTREEAAAQAEANRAAAERIGLARMGEGNFKGKDGDGGHANCHEAKEPTEPKTEHREPTCEPKTRDKD